MAGLTVDDVDVLQLYDCYTYTVLLTLEDYGFCAKGEAGELVRSGATAPGGSLPVNTGGGQLSALLHVGNDATVRGRHPDPWDRRSTPSRKAGRRDGQWQRRHPQPSQHPGPQSPSAAEGMKMNIVWNR